ncbi:MAG: McrC family protein, partial [Spirochaetota bacterium]|nr:McrC family protein [Spirochaetota bacterium]
YVKARSYVGLIQTKSGYTIEILPKIYDKKDDKDGEKNKKILLNMLQKIKDLPSFKDYNLANLKLDKLPLLEIFIKMFLDEVLGILKRGLLSNYVLRESNLRFLKGKLKFNEHIKFNYIHKERFYVEYDEFLSDIPENRLLKSTLQLLMKISSNFDNQKIIRELIFTFEDIPRSEHIEVDFIKCRKDRSVDHYKNAMIWSNIFLKNKSFSTYKGTSIAFALLFPMEKVFEKYVTYLLRRQDKVKFESLKTPDRSYYLTQEDDKNIFRIEPDFVGETDDKVYIMDTKWKIIDENDKDNKYDLSQPDLYQLFSYGKIYEATGKYKEVKLYLFYPENPNLNSVKEFVFQDSSKLKLKLCPVDCNDQRNLNQFF